MREWLRQRLLNILHPKDSDVYPAKLAVSASSDGVDMDSSLRFNVLVGSGGVVVQIHRYDRKNDRSNNTTHIIADGEPIAERIGQIVSMEILKG
jgi:hypothetical protein